MVHFRAILVNYYLLPGSCHVFVDIICYFFKIDFGLKVEKKNKFQAFARQLESLNYAMQYVNLVKQGINCTQAKRIL